MSEPQQRNAKPSTVELLFGRLLVFLIRIGLVRGHFFVLEVRGRKTGRTTSLPVDPILVDGERYLVCPRGETQWVKNARVAGEVTLIQSLRLRHHALRELAPEARPRILKANLDAYAAEVQRFFPVPKGSPAEAFAGLAPRYPVFALSERR
jgi:hypothetical protein